MSTVSQLQAALAKVAGAEAVLQADYAAKGYHLGLELPADKLLELAQAMLAEGCFLEFVTAVDRVEALEVVYMFGHLPEPGRVRVSVMAPKGTAVPSLANLIPGADWHEREAYDMMGQQFAGHPDLRRILLPEDADFHPLLKDFQATPGPAEA